MYSTVIICLTIIICLVVVCYFVDKMYCHHVDVENSVDLMYEDMNSIINLINRSVEGVYSEAAKHNLTTIKQIVSKYIDEETEKAEDDNTNNVERNDASCI